MNSLQFDLHFQRTDMIQVLLTILCVWKTISLICSKFHQWITMRCSFESDCTLISVISEVPLSRVGPVHYRTVCNSIHINYLPVCKIKTSIFESYVYWTMHHLDSWIKTDQLMSLALFFAQHVSNASTFIFRSLRLFVGILLFIQLPFLNFCNIRSALVHVFLP